MFRSMRKKPHAGNNDTSFVDVLEQFFGGSISKTPDLSLDVFASLYLTALQMEHGVIESIQPWIMVRCEQCVCEACGGKPPVVMSRQTFIGTISTSTQCRSCVEELALAKIRACLFCSGEGRSWREEELQVAIPAGLIPGCRLRYPGRGHCSQFGDARGSLYVDVQIKLAPEIAETR